ncbi:MAG: hypothetical protein LC676_07470 [Loktanella sp.]|nr:hypothetical protein [Loktanella sp.]
MDEHFVENLRKAARAGMPDYADAAAWAAGLDHIARKAQRPGEPFESAYLRIAEAPDGAAMYRAMQQAADSEMAGIAKRRSAAGRPADRTPVEIVGDAAETELAKRAEQRARLDGCSFEQGYTKIVAEPEGAELFKAAMAR